MIFCPLLFKSLTNQRSPAEQNDGTIPTRGLCSHHHATAHRAMQTPNPHRRYFHHPHQHRHLLSRPTDCFSRLPNRWSCLYCRRQSENRAL